MRIVLITLISFCSITAFAQDSYQCQMMNITLYAPEKYKLHQEFAYKDSSSTKTPTTEIVQYYSSGQTNGGMVSVVAVKSNAIPTLAENHEISIADCYKVCKARGYTITKEENKGYVKLEGNTIAKHYAFLTHPSDSAQHLEIYTYIDDKNVWAMLLFFDNETTKKALFESYIRSLRSMK